MEYTGLTHTAAATACCRAANGRFASSPPVHNGVVSIAPMATDAAMAEMNRPAAVLPMPVAAKNSLSRAENPVAQRAAGLVIGLFVLQLVLGGINVILLAPVWLQLVHLLVSNLIWIVQVALTSFVIGRPNRAAGVADHPIHERVPGSAE